MIVKVVLSSKSAHFGTAFSNHTCKMSYTMPSKSMLNGLLGASLGKSFLECQEFDYRYSFKWLTENTSSIIAKKRLMIKNSLDVKQVIQSKDWERGELKGSIDFEETIISSSGRLYGEWLIEVKSLSEAKEIRESLLNPYYPLYLGKSEHFIKIESVDLLETIVKAAVNELVISSWFIGTSKRYLFTERMSSKMKSYRMPVELEDVYTLNRKVIGIPKYGYCEVEGENYAMW